MKSLLFTPPKARPSPNSQQGATMVEYAIMLALIAVVSLGVITTLGQNVSTTFNTVNTSLSSG